MISHAAPTYMAWELVLNVLKIYSAYFYSVLASMRHQNHMESKALATQIYIFECLFLVDFIL